MEQRVIVQIWCAALRSLCGRIVTAVQAGRLAVAGALAGASALSAPQRTAFAAACSAGSDASAADGTDRSVADSASHEQRPLVLVAEDNAGNYRLIEVILRNAYRLQHALNGQEAVELFDRERPDIVLMDINMPLMDGYEALRLIRERDQQVPVIALTAYAFDSDLQKMLECGFDACMTKPISVNGIKALVESKLRK